MSSFLRKENRPKNGDCTVGSEVNIIQEKLELKIFVAEILNNEK
jgi:hypothetical protein